MMKRKLLHWLPLLGLIVLAFGCAMPAQPLVSEPGQEKLGQEQAASKTINGLGQALPQPAPGSTVFPLPTAFPAIDWGPPPDCVNSPKNPGLLAQALAQSSAAKLDLQRARRFSPRLAQMNTSGLQTLLAGSNSAAGTGSLAVYAGLATNIATGRLNRATAVNFTALPEIKTIGDLYDRLDNSLDNPQPDAQALQQAAEQVQAGQGITQAVCAHALTTKSANRLGGVIWAGQEMRTETVPVTVDLTQRFVMDTATTSPDGRWSAFTSTGNDSGGPMYLLNLGSGAWTNLIELVNTSHVEKQPRLPMGGWWDVIGWLPDSQHLMIGAGDASAVYISDINTGQTQVIPFNGGGKGGGMFIGLALDGSQFAFVGLAEGGDGQVLSTYHLSSGEITPLLTLPYSAGIIYYPRFAPDGQSLSYILQKGQPESGFSYAIHQMDLQNQQDTILLEGNLGLSVPTWSPDGRYLAFTKKDQDEPDHFDLSQPLAQPKQNIWVFDISTGKSQQITFINGQASRPQWATDARTLGFITHDGSVGLVQVDQPERIWEAAGAEDQLPEFSSVFFLP